MGSKKIHREIQNKYNKFMSDIIEENEKRLRHLYDGYIILSKISQKDIGHAIKYGDIFSVDPRKTGVHIGDDESVYTFTVNRSINIGRKLKMAKAQVKEVAWGVYEDNGEFTGNTFPIKKDAVEYISGYSSTYGYKVVKVFVTPFVAKKK